jgi:(p)ppGpp synthase/HD superfamily hydrolase
MRALAAPRANSFKGSRSVTPKFTRLVDQMRTGSGRTGSDPTPLLQLPVDQAVIADALRIATMAHQGQMRADLTTYVAHPIRVARLAATWEENPDQDIVAAALLHDVIEDSDTPLAQIADQIGTRVATIVDTVSAAKPSPDETTKQRRVRKLAKLARLRGADAGTLLVHACDVLDNTISWRYVRPIDAAWSKIPRWMFQLRQYQLDLLDPHYPQIAGLLCDELRFQQSRGLDIGSWDTP